MRQARSSTGAASFGVTFVSLTLLTSTAPAEAAFGFRKPLTIQGARVSGAPHANFPVLISIVDPNLRVRPAGRVSSPTGCDIAFMTSGGALLDHEIERYDGASGTLVAWVRIPSLPAANTTIFVYYGDSEIRCPQNSSAAVWDTSYRYVYHFSETAGNPLDSTANMVAATLNPQGDPAAVENRNAAGQIAGALEFTTPPAPPPATFLQTTDSHLTLADGVLPANQPFTIEGWFNATTWGGAGVYIGLVTKGRDSAPGFVDWVGIDKVPQGANARLALIMQLPETNVAGGTNLLANTWYYATVTFDGASARRVYLNGALDGSDLVTATTYPNIVENTRVGDDSNGNYLNGRVDEIRFSNVLRSAGWIQTTYNNSSCPSTSTCGVAANRFVVEGAQQLPPTNYRSIGDTTTPYSTGSITAAAGSAVVTGTGTAWKTANRGRGDSIDIGGTFYTVLSVNSETQLTLTTTAANYSGGYSINRKFATLADWEECIDGGGSPCGPDPAVASANFMNDDRREVGIVYKDKVYVDSVVDASSDVLVINGSTPGPFHTITLTADFGNRHNGIPGTGVILDLQGAAVECQGVAISDGFTTVEWMEVRNGAASADGIAVNTVGKVVVRNNLVHNLGDRGIQVHGAAVIRDVDIYDNVVYRAFRGIFVEDAVAASSTIRIMNNTVYASSSAGAAGIGAVAPGGGTPVTLRNNISHSNAGGDFGVPSLNPASSHNLAGDATGIAHSPAGGGIDSVPLTGAGGVNFFDTNPGTENLHIQNSSRAKDAGADLSCFLTYDIDGMARVTPWDIGADDASVTTAVVLQSFAATPLDGAVELAWQTASELSNLGFHLYRSAAESGPYVQITTSLVPGLGSSAVGARYSYLDAGLTNGATFYYKLQDVEATGRTELHGPVSATPQAGPAPAGSAGTAAPGASPARISYGDPTRVELRVARRGGAAVELELVTGGFFATPEADGSVRLEVPSFEVVDTPGSPAIPVKRASLAAVAGRGVRIVGVAAEDVVGFSSLRPALAEAPELVVGRDGTVRVGKRRARAAWRSRGLTPEQAARVVSTAFQGELKRALVELSPLRWDPASRQLLLARRLRVRVAFAGREPGETGLGGSRGRRPRRGRDDRESAPSLVARLVARESGLYAVGFEQLFPTQRRALAASELRLSRLGEPVAFHVEPNGSRFGPGSALYFLSEGASLSAYANDVVYELGLGAGGMSMPLGSASPGGLPLGYAFKHRSFEQNRFYLSGLLEAPELWLWDALLSPALKAYAFNLDGLARASEPGTLQVWLQGASDFGAEPDHHVRAYLNGALVGEASWDGKRPYTLQAPIPPGLLREGENRLELENLADTAAAYSMVYLDRFALDYPGTLAAEAGRFAARSGSDGTAVLAGLGAGSSVLDTSEADSPRWLGGALAGPGGLAVRVEAGRRYLAVSPQALLRPEIRWPLASDLRSARNQADYLLLAPRALLPAATALLELRQSQGLRARSVALEEIFEVFGWGERSPQAIQDFVGYAYQQWAAPAPRYVLLLGDASYDPKNYVAGAVKDRLPAFILKSSYLWAPSDPHYAAVNGEDELPDLAIGRLPAASLEEAQRLVEKTIAFEAAGFDLSGPAVLVADNPDPAGDFEANAEEIAARLPASSPLEKLYLGQLGVDATHAAIMAAFDRGASLVSYVGHGGTAVWASENLLNSWDLPQLAPQPRQPLVLTMNCLNGYFVPPSFDSLAEALVKAEARGAIAAFSPSGLSLNEPAHLYHQALVAELASGRHARLGDAVLAAQADYASTGAFPELLSLYHLFGDPALRIR